MLNADEKSTNRILAYEWTVRVHKDANGPVQRPSNFLPPDGSRSYRGQFPFTTLKTLPHVTISPTIFVNDAIVDDDIVDDGPATCNDIVNDALLNKPITVQDFN